MWQNVDWVKRIVQNVENVLICLKCPSSYFDRQRGDWSQTSPEILALSYISLCLYWNSNYRHFKYIEFNWMLDLGERPIKRIKYKIYFSFIGGRKREIDVCMMRVKESISNLDKYVLFIFLCNSYKISHKINIYLLWLIFSLLYVHRHSREVHCKPGIWEMVSVGQHHLLHLTSLGSETFIYLI